MSKLSLILGIALVAVSLILARSCNKTQAYKLDSESYADLLASEKENTQTWIDKDGLNRARINAVESSNEALRNYIPELEKTVSGLKKDLSNLRNLSQISTTTSGEVITKLRDTVYLEDADTVYAKTFTYTDKWSSFNGNIGDNIRINYTVRDSITFFQYWRGKTFFKKGTLVFEGISHNPNTKISGLRNIGVIQPRKRKISIGPTISYGFGNNGLQWNIGIGVQWKLIEF